MLANIIDHRKNRYAAQRINVVIEAAWHDNSIEGADQYPTDTGPDCDSVRDISLMEAVALALTDFRGPVTLFLYDLEVDPMAVTRFKPE